MHPEVLLDELDSRGCCMLGRDIQLKSREARVSIRPHCMVAGSHLMYVCMYVLQSWAVHSWRGDYCPESGSGIINMRE